MFVPQRGQSLEMRKNSSHRMDFDFLSPSASWEIGEIEAVVPHSIVGHKLLKLSCLWAWSSS